MQHGAGGAKILHEAVPAYDDDGRREAHGVRIAGFEFRSEGLGEEMRAAKGDGTRGFGGEGVVVCHAGRFATFLGDLVWERL